MFAVRLFSGDSDHGENYHVAHKIGKGMYAVGNQRAAGRKHTRHNLGSAQSGVTPEAHPRDMPGLFHAFLRCQFLCHTIF